MPKNTKKRYTSSILSYLYLIYYESNSLGNNNDYVYYIYVDIITYIFSQSLRFGLGFIRFIACIYTYILYLIKVPWYEILVWSIVIHSEMEGLCHCYDISFTL